MVAKFTRATFFDFQHKKKILNTHHMGLHFTAYVEHDDSGIVNIHLLYLIPKYVKLQHFNLSFGRPFCVLYNVNCMSIFLPYILREIILSLIPL